jgi:hypothetical protein
MERLIVTTSNIFENEIYIKNKFIKNITKFNKDFNEKSVLANSKHVLENHLNFFNFENKDEIKKIIDYEILKLHVEYPNASNLLVSWIVDYYSLNQNGTENISKIKIKNFIDSRLLKYENKVSRVNKTDDILSKIKSKKVKSIVENILTISDADDVVFVEKSSRSETVIKKTNQVNFLIDFDIDFLLNRTMIEKEDYNYIIIDGYIDKISEIYHLLEEANTTKEPYVIFCKGMSTEVKSIIIKNLIRKTIDVTPVSLKINEENVNVLNDIASCHDNEIVSSFKGDTISSAVRRVLKKGKYLKITNNSLIIKFKNDKIRKKQLSFLNKKIKYLNNHDPNKEFLSKRIKSLNSKKINIYLSKNFSDTNSKELDSAIKNLNNLKRGIVYDHDQNSYICYVDLAFCISKFFSIVNIISQIGGAICVIKEEENGN